LILLSIAALYLWFLAIFGIFGRKQYPDLKGNFDFLILVPAHNEEKVIEETLESLQKLDPVGSAEIVVIADNCTDNTADKARSYNVSVIERHEPNRRGKGYALEYALSKYSMVDFDAVVIIDADTVADQNMLSVMARSLTGGAGAVQVSNEFSIAQETSLAFLQQMANKVENLFFYRGRAVLGLPILLRGTGMAIKTDVLVSHPWSSYSVTEDVDYAVNLIMAGIQIGFTDGCRVLSSATSSYRQSYSQKERWASGTFRLIFEKAIPLIGHGIAKLRFDLLELACSLFILSRPLLIFTAMIIMILALIWGGNYQIHLSVWSAILILMLSGYLLSGILLVPKKSPAFKAVIQAPFFGIWLIILQVRSLFRRDSTAWIRTERRGDERN
jgi:cellulose synthase/poly-beta-1,6-N-acetylglucosamine synthase-like glycosyltransferase